jgi:hypothetical protein
MSTNSSYCGLSCSTCPIHLATIEPDPEVQSEIRAAVAKQCLDEYKIDLCIDDITDCDGCTTANGRLFSGCVHCMIRPCAIQKGVINCAYCSDYPCDTLKKFFLQEDKARLGLEEIRSSIGK